MKKLDEEGFFDSKKKEDEEEPKPYTKFTHVTY
jgi:hypothetical protein